MLGGALGGLERGNRDETARAPLRPSTATCLGSRASPPGVVPPRANSREASHEHLAAPSWLPFLALLFAPPFLATTLAPASLEAFPALAASSLLLDLIAPPPSVRQSELLVRLCVVVAEHCNFETKHVKEQNSVTSVPDSLYNSCSCTAPTIPFLPSQALRSSAPLFSPPLASLEASLYGETSPHKVGLLCWFC